jgi:hypothetical protein
MDSTLSLTHRKSRRPPGAAQLIVAMVGATPLERPTRHILDGIDQVTMGRGERGAERQGRALRISIADRAISTEHVSLVRAHTGWLLEDTGSKNGTFVNGSRRVRTALADGDVIELGSTSAIYRDRVPPVLPENLDLVGREGATFSSVLAAALDALDQVAMSGVSVVIVGATGTGKEVTARRLHDRSRRKGPFVAMNCGAIPAELVESTLFGHRRGAFSGASRTARGWSGRRITGRCSSTRSPI